MTDVLTRMRAICADLPAVKEKPHFGGVVFTAGGKTFASCARTVVTFQPVAEMRAALEGDPRFTPYPRDKRALVMDVSGPTDWNLVKQLVFDSYGLHAGIVKKPPARGAAAPKQPTKKPAPPKKKPATPAKKPAKKSAKKR
jgi:hypothetical protein